MSWRPEGWHLPLGLCDHDAKEGEIVTATLLSEREKVLFEAGADAILEALRKDGTHLDEGTDDARFPTDEPGTEVFIPDDEETKLLRDG